MCQHNVTCEEELRIWLADWCDEYIDTNMLSSMFSNLVNKKFQILQRLLNNLSAFQYYYVHMFLES